MSMLSHLHIFKIASQNIVRGHYLWYSTLKGRVHTISRKFGNLSVFTYRVYRNSRGAKSSVGCIHLDGSILLSNFKGALMPVFCPRSNDNTATLCISKPTKNRKCSALLSGFGFIWLATYSS